CLTPPASGIYLLSLHDALPIFVSGAVDGEDVLGLVRRLLDFLAQFRDEVVDRARRRRLFVAPDLVEDLLAGDDLAGMRDQISEQDRKSTRLNSSHLGISYAVFC